jgi:hypothetical protein
MDSLQSSPITLGPGIAGGTKSSGRGNHSGGGTMGNVGETDAVLGRVLCISCRGRFMWPFAVAGLGLRYFSMSFSERLGHLLRNPFRTALNNVEILGLHNDWCVNLTPLARIFTECMNEARFMPGCIGASTSCRAQSIIGADHGRADCKVCPLIGSIHRLVSRSL